MEHHKMHDRHDQHMGMSEHDHHAMMIADFKKRFYVVLALTVPIMLLSTMIQHFMGVSWQFKGSSYILFALSSVVFVYGGWPFLTGLVSEAKAKNPGMMFLIGFAITVAYSYSVAIVFGLKGWIFFGNWLPLSSLCF
jgi:Cu2+-exporting ATPase